MASPAVKRILVPLDGSPIAESILPYAVGFAEAIGAGLLLFQAIPGEDEAVAKAAEAHLEDVAATLRESGMGVATDATSGETAQEIVAAARRYEAGLIMMTGHASVHGRKDLLGSTAHTVLRRCTVPVLVVPLGSTSWTPPAAIVVGHDGSESARAALEPAAMLASALGCELALVRAIEPVAGLGGAARYYGTVDDFAEKDLNEVRDELSGSGLKVTAHTGKRPAVQELLGVAGSRSGSVIAVSTSNLSAETNVLGSTTDRLVRSQTHPVLAVPAR